MLFVLILSGGKQTSTFKPFKLRLEFKIEQRTEVGIYKGRLHLIIICYLINESINLDPTHLHSLSWALNEKYMDLSLS